jgi:hypothetical protein
MTRNTFLVLASVVLFVLAAVFAAGVGTVDGKWVTVLALAGSASFASAHLP